MNKKGLEISSWIGIIVAIAFGCLIIFADNTIIFDSFHQKTNEQKTTCQELTALGYITSLNSSNGFVTCYIYLSDGRKVIYDDIKNNINVEFMKG